MVEGWGKFPPILGKFENLKFRFWRTLAFFCSKLWTRVSDFFCTNRQNPGPARASENWNEIALLEFEKNSVEFRKKTRVCRGDARKFLSPPILGKCENLKFGLRRTLAYFWSKLWTRVWDFFCTSRENPCPTRASESLNEKRYRVEFEKNSVEFRKNACFMEMRENF